MSSPKRQRIENSSNSKKMGNSINGTTISDSLLSLTGDLQEWMQAVEGSVVVSTLEDLPDGPDSDFLCTHHGGFHCDEALALAMVKLLPEYRNLPILRTRNMDIIAKAKLVVDVGGIYSMEKLRFDHHMGDFTTTYSEKHTVTKLSSAGLIYKHFGSQIVAKLAAGVGQMDGGATSAFEGNDAGLETVVKKLYRNFIEEIDAIDNGVEAAENMKYRVSSGLGSRVKRCNGSWLNDLTPAEENKRFTKAMTLCGVEFYEQTYGLVHEWYPARKIIEDAAGKVNAAYRIAESAAGNGNGVSNGNTSAPTGSMSRVMILEKCCPWQEHMMDLEDQLSIGENERLLYVVFPDTRSGTYRIQACPSARGSFLNRKPLPEPWRGVRDEDLSKVSGIEGGVFVHASGFIGGNKTLEGALEMAKQSIEKF